MKQGTAGMGSSRWVMIRMMKGCKLDLRRGKER